MIQSSSRLDFIEEYYFSKKLKEIDDLKKKGNNIINLGIGSPDLPPHPEVIRTLADYSRNESVHGYQGYKGSEVLRKAFSDWYKLHYDVKLDSDYEILPLIGSKEGIMHISMAFLNKGDKVLIPNPGYPAYKTAALLAGAECIEYSLTEANDWFPDFNLLKNLDLGNVKMMWINYPNMPTGQLPTKEFFKDIISFGRANNILICHDNPYSFILNDKPISILEIGNAMDTALELNSLSKSHNMAGWRIGMIAAKKEIINTILKFKSNMDSGMFLPVQFAAAKALSLPAEWYQSVNMIYKERRDKVFELLDLLDCTYNKKQAGMFVWAKLNTTKDAYSFTDELLYKTNLFITPGGIFGSAGENFIRISLCSPVEILNESIQRVENII